ncbi:putative MFS family arabinose efflux permease [Kribbella antiqua]|uniref:Putative MFS family arabinose efflux permease n=1 Tax=Kribbella antiqua TaxID=2512217 RepID=A0A4R2J503_9ACTN|nr:MFS transporter [Kribbella antiqua]TCO51758.1 putative MFS family arabinose efflux permease [Kribbella antiqua]
MTATLPERLRDDPDFRRYWLARTLSFTGSMITAVAMPVLVYRLSGSTLLTASVTALEAAPYLVTGLFAGALSDRWNRRRVMVSADLVNAVVVGSIPLAHLLGVLTVVHALVVAFTVQAVYSFFDGANFGALPVLVGRARVAQANSAVWTASSLIELFVPTLAGLALAVLNPADLLALDALSFVASAIAVRAIVRALSEPRAGQAPLRPRVLLADIAEGIRFLVRHPGVRTMTMIGTLQSFAGGGFVGLMVVWCDRILHVGTSGVRFGIVWGAWGIGGLVAAVGLPRLLKRLAPAAITLYAVPTSAVLGIVTALVPRWELAAIALLLWGSAYILVIVNSISYRQQVTPEQLLGRVNTAGRMLSWGVGWTLGSITGGVLGSHYGIRTAMVVMGVFGFVGAVVAWTSPLRRIAANHDPGHDPLRA